MNTAARQDAAAGSVVLIGIGNDLRGDDGLGWAFVDAVAERGRFEGALHHRYQLQAEDAALLRDAERVIFVDAHADGDRPGFDVSTVTPDAHFEFTSHAFSPGALMHVCRSLYGRCPEAILITIPGHQWALGDPLSAQAKDGLAQALAAFDTFKRSRLG